MNELIKEFEDMDKLPIIELKINGEWDYFTINIEHTGLIWCFTELDRVKMFMDCDFSLDENLQSFYELLTEYLMSNNYEIGE